MGVGATRIGKRAGDSRWLGVGGVGNLPGITILGRLGMGLAGEGSMITGWPSIIWLTAPSLYARDGSRRASK
jgi:hypothetical protein